MTRFILLLFFLIIRAPSYLLSQDIIVPVEPSETWANNQHQPEKLMDAIGLKEGMTIADIGAGRGRMTVFFSVRVGEKGKVYANEINETSLQYLKERCKRNNMKNVTTFLGTVDSPLLPAGEVDIAFMLMTYHHLEKPVDMMKNTIPCLKKDGVLVIVEHDPERSGETGSEMTTLEKLKKEAKEAGFEIVRINSELLERDNLYFLKPKN
ncbi:MAG: class I SAM-dependent methyltransferase [Bacteroidales bacterium]|nr:class I SAM-dependent methyltransferase [Bacteroidales bacterium]